MSELISRKQAIDVATSATMEWDGMYVQDLNVRIRKWRWMMSELISRKQAIDVATSATMEWDGMYVQDLNVRIREAIEQLPPAEPKRGKWIIKDDTERFIAQCNCCRYIEDSRRIKNFCPNCGADMREVTT